MNNSQLFPVVLSLAAPLFAACSRPATAHAPVRPVRAEAVSVESAPGGVRYSATIQASEQVPLAFKVGGYVNELRRSGGVDGAYRTLQQGDEVTRGHVLARLNAADYQEKVNHAKGQLAEASANLEKARADAARADRLYASRSLTRPDYDGARAGLGMAEARAAAARAALQSAEIALRDTVLVSPLNGVVMARQVEVGTLASPGVVGFVIADLTHVKAVFGVPDRLVSRARVGRPLTVTSDVYGSRGFNGRITAVSPSADAQSRAFSVEVTISNPERLLKPGMVATVEVPAGDQPASEGLPTVALSAVVKATGGAPGYAVFVAETAGGKGADGATVARARAITLGPITGNRVSVTSGVQNGEQVIVTGASLLRDGEPVRLIPGGEER
jgi:RND family efflux transporter MFP subunit